MGLFGRIGLRKGGGAFAASWRLTGLGERKPDLSFVVERKIIVAEGVVHQGGVVRIKITCPVLVEHECVNAQLAKLDAIFAISDPSSRFASVMATYLEACDVVGGPVHGDVRDIPERKD